jgi:hypothetical protein
VALGESVFYPVGKGASIPREEVAVNNKDPGCSLRADHQLDAGSLTLEKFVRMIKSVLVSDMLYRPFAKSPLILPKLSAWGQELLFQRTVLTVYLPSAEHCLRAENTQRSNVAADT